MPFSLFVRYMYPECAAFPPKRGHLSRKFPAGYKRTPLQKAHELFCRHALRVTGAGAVLAFVLASLLGRGGFQPLLAGLNVAGALLILRIAFCKELPELKCQACNRDIARPLLFALAVLFALFAAGHLTGFGILMSLAITLEHAALFAVAIRLRL